MFLDCRDLTQPITFMVHKLIPLWFRILKRLFLLTAVAPTPFLYIAIILWSEHIPTWLIIIWGVWISFGFLLISSLTSIIERHAFHYVVTFNETQFSISYATFIYHPHKTACFPRHNTYQFNEKSKTVLIRDTYGYQHRFKYNDDFRKFLEEIQIN